MIGVLWLYKMCETNVQKSNYAYARNPDDVDHIVKQVTSLYEPRSVDNNIIFRLFDIDNESQRQRFDTFIKRFGATRIPM